MNIDRFLSGSSMNTHTYLYCGGQPDRSEGRGITHVIVKDGVTSIEFGAFRGWYYLVSVNIASSVTRIGVGAFSACESLSSIHIPDSVQVI